MDVRLALQDVGAFRPEINIMEEQCKGEEDMRGLEEFLKWIQGDGNREIRRIAGLAPSEGEVVALEAGEEREDFLSVLKKKHSKTGEESRYQGTALGKFADGRLVAIEGGEADSIQAWEAKLYQRNRAEPEASSRKSDSAIATDDSSPLSDI
ncbi:MAG: hypothetical protein Q9191_004121 [Dirinaria sp. TL-2023a]